jgi:NAD(P)-dependent dehydrogenase (short-subunit alcohol dehydrogenase family)
MQGKTVVITGGTSGIREVAAVALAKVGARIVLVERFIIRENVKDLALSKASKDAPETIGDSVPTNIVLHALPSEVGAKVPQVRSHMFFIKDGNNVIVLVSPTDRRIADVIR